MFVEDDIVKVQRNGEVTLARVLDSTTTDVLVFKDTGNVWLSLDEYEITKLSSV